MIDSRFIPDVPSSDPPVTHRPEAHRFENVTDGQLSFATYQLDRSARRVVFDHTLVPPQLQGRGIAAALVSTALDWAAAQGLQVVPACSYVAIYMRRHPETQRLLKPQG